MFTLDFLDVSWFLLLLLAAVVLVLVKAVTILMCCLVQLYLILILEKPESHFSHAHLMPHKEQGCVKVTFRKCQ